ncbi:TPA: hypothetical protein HA235_04060 [Candidatus Woesearchaeota archaeon]|nr:hypothetical protein [uncultured archaeon]MBS3173052.1 hypothetical protein [Candidatus Woesearchaeota archaeon]AQS32960.1 hypothetical protein [uncultured archaeon]HIH31858.1 hypothetical protein [Candidatus Woesearchaeota archaeon]HIH54391.1 hypothetical protein [Candidatus Woesearchaeota archaeon]
MARGYELKKDTIIIYRELTMLDLFLKKFLGILKKHSDYLVVSGFVSISTGRTRGTEDIDVIIPVMSKDSFDELLNDLIKNNFWCYQGDTSNEVFEYIKNLESVRFAKVNEMFPNIELIPFNSTKKAKSFEFNHPQKVKIKSFEFKIPPIEFEILYKELVLAGRKDVEDARHLRIFFSEIIDERKFKEYKLIILCELK